MKLYNQLKLRFGTLIGSLHPKLALFDILLDKNPDFMQFVRKDFLSGVKESSFVCKNSPTLETGAARCHVQRDKTPHIQGIRSGHV